MLRTGTGWPPSDADCSSASIRARSRAPSSGVQRNTSPPPPMPARLLGVTSSCFRSDGCSLSPPPPSASLRPPLLAAASHSLACPPARHRVYGRRRHHSVACGFCHACLLKMRIVGIPQADFAKSEYRLLMRGHVSRKPGQPGRSLTTTTTTRPCELFSLPLLRRNSPYPQTATPRCRRPRRGRP